MRNAYQTRKSGTLEKNTLLFEIEIGDENKNERKGVAQGEVGGWPDMEGWVGSTIALCLPLIYSYVFFLNIKGCKICS